jgi:hypothetical protein
MSVIRARPPTRLHLLLLQTLLRGLLPPEQDANVFRAIQVPPPGCRRLALAQGRVRAVAGSPEFPAHDAPGVFISVRGDGASSRGRPGRQQGQYGQYGQYGQHRIANRAIHRAIIRELNTSRCQSAPRDRSQPRDPPRAQKGPRHPFRNDAAATMIRIATAPSRYWRRRSPSSTSRFRRRYRRRTFPASGSADRRRVRPDASSYPARPGLR